MTDREPDSTISEIRREISGIDRTIVDAVNTRIELVKRLKTYKAEQGIPFLDPDRERRLIDELVAANPGPLTADGLRELYAGLLDLTKREVQ